MSGRSKELIENSIEQIKSLREQIEWLKAQPESDEQKSIINTINGILSRYTNDEEIVQLTLPKNKWNSFLEFDKQYKK